MVKMAKMMWFNSSIFTGKNTGITTFRNKMSGQRSLLKNSRNQIACTDFPNQCTTGEGSHPKQMPLKTSASLRYATLMGNQKHWDSAYLCQGMSYHCCDTDPDPLSGSPPKFNHLFIGPLPTFPENFVQIRSKFFSSQSC